MVAAAVPPQHVETTLRVDAVGARHCEVHIGLAAGAGGIVSARAEIDGLGAGEVDLDLVAEHVAVAKVDAGSVIAGSAVGAVGAELGARAAPERERHQRGGSER